MPRKGYGWYYHPPKPPKPKVPEEIKEKIKAISDEFVMSFLKPKYMICDTSYNTDFRRVYKFHNLSVSKQSEKPFGKVNLHS